MMAYKVYVEAILCDRWQCDFLKRCDLGITDVGKEVKMSFITEEEPTSEELRKITELLLSTKDNKELKQYYSSVRINCIEKLGEWSDE